MECKSSVKVLIGHMFVGVADWLIGWGAGHQVP